MFRMTLYDAFLSYRRSDGAPAARWLRRSLRGYRLPRNLREGRPPRLSVFLDTFYARGTTDFYEQTIRPALLASRHLIVVATPQATHRGDDDWIAREIADFLSHGNLHHIYVVRAIGDAGDPIPGDLLQRYPRVQIIDLRGAGTWRSWVPPHSDRLRGALLELIAPLYGIPPEQMPQLRAEEVVRQRTRIGLGLGLFAAVTALSVLVSVSAVQRQSQGQAAIDEGLSATTRIVRTLALGQPEVEDFGRDVNEMLLGACVIARRLATDSTVPLDPASRLVCEMEAALEAAGTLSAPGEATATEILLDNCIAGARLTSDMPDAVPEDCTSKPFDRRDAVVSGRLRAATAEEFARLGAAARTLLKDSAAANPEELTLRAQLAYRALRYEHRVRETATGTAIDAERLLVSEIVQTFLAREVYDTLNEHNYHVEALIWQNVLVERLFARLTTGPEADFATTLAALETVVAQAADVEAQVDRAPELDALLLVQRSVNYESLARALSDRGAYSDADATILRAKEAMQRAIDQHPDHPDHAQWRVWQLAYDDQRLRLMEQGVTDAAYVTLAMKTIATARAIADELPAETQLAQDVDAGWRDAALRLHAHHDRMRVRSREEAARGEFDVALARLDKLLQETKALYTLSDDNGLWPTYYLLLVRAERNSFLARSGAAAEAEAHRRALYAEMLAAYDPAMPGLNPGQQGDFVSAADSVEAAHFAYLDDLDAQAAAALDAGAPEQAVELLGTLRAADRAWDLMRGGLSQFDRVYWAEKGIQLAAALDAAGRGSEADALRLRTLRILLPLAKDNDLEGENLNRGRVVWNTLSDWAEDRGIAPDTLSPIEDPLAGEAQE